MLAESQLQFGCCDGLIFLIPFNLNDFQLFSFRRKTKRSFGQCRAITKYVVGRKIEFFYESAMV